MTQKTLRAGLIGYGMIGKVHAYATATLPWYAPELPIVGRISAVATSRMETALQAQEQIGCDAAYDDYRRVVEDPSIDVVHVCVPNALHLPVLLAAIKANKRIYCEKPLVVNSKEASVLRDALRDSHYSQANMLAHHLRGFAALRRAKEMIDAGRLGQIVRYRVAYRHSSMLDPTTPWRWKNDASGGSILDLASHLVDLVDWLIGLPAILIAQTSTFVTVRPKRPLKQDESLDDVPRQLVLAEDSVSILTRGLRDANRVVPRIPSSRVFERPEIAGFDPDVMPIAVSDPNKAAAITGMIEATKLASGAEDELELEIGGSQGSLRFSLMNPHYLEYFDARVPFGTYGGDAGWKKIACGARYPSPESDFPSPKSTCGWLRAHVASLAAFYRGIADGKVYGADFEQGLKIQDALSKIAASSHGQFWIDL